MSEGHKLGGQIAILSGAANGIGRAIALAFAEAGATVVIADVAVPAARLVAEEIVAAGGRAEAVQCDVSRSDEVRRVVDDAARDHGGLDIVVCGAAVFSPVVPLHEMGEEDWQQALAVNLSGAFHLCKHAIPHLKARGGGKIILIASQMARVANAGQTAYCATKGALVQLAKGMALDYASENIRVNTLSPGGIATERLVKRFGDLDTAQAVWGPKHPLGRLGEPEEMARGALFLASEESSFMTGADLLLDGGYTAW